jgi:hypothetical protein
LFARPSGTRRELIAFERFVGAFFQAGKTARKSGTIAQQNLFTSGMKPLEWSRTED